jgi:hypothetical protein
MRGRSLHLFCLIALIAAALLALMASTAVAAPRKVTTTNPDAEQCGIAGSQVETFMVNGHEFAGNKVTLEIWDSWTFTATATGKSIESFAAEQQTSNVDPIDNGDGTVSFVFTFKGLEQRLKLPNGTVLVRDAGPITFTLTFDASGDLVSFGSSDEKGPHPLADGGGYCDVLVPALT